MGRREAAFSLGIGSALVKTPNEMHRGTLEIEPGLGEGSAVTLSLPQPRPLHQGKAV